MADGKPAKMSRGEALYGKKSGGDEKPPVKKTDETPKPKEDGGGEPTMAEKHMKAMRDMHHRHEVERRDMHASHREDHRKMHTRHEQEYADLAKAQEQEMGAGQQGEGGPAAPTPTAAAPATTGAA